MTQDEIIEMAKKCGWNNPATNMMPLYEFAKLVAQHEREACAKVCEQHGYEHYCGNVTDKLAEIIRARGQSQVCCEEYNTCVRPCTPRGRLYGQKEEREACAKVATEHAAEYKVGGRLYTMLGMNTSKPVKAACEHIAHLISARGQA